MRFGVLLIVAVLAVNAVPVAAGPTIDIRAQTQLQLEKVQLREEGLAEVSGQLLDKLTGDGIGGQQVRIRLGGETVTATTTPDGKFRTNMAVTAGPQEIHIEFGGAAMMEESALTMITDPSRTQVTLAVIVDEPTQAGGSPTLTVRATANDLPVKLPIDIFVGAPTDKELKKLRTVGTETPFTVTRADAGGAGTRRVRASFVGDDSRQPASTEVTLELVEASTTTMQLSSTSLAFEDDLGVKGKVVDGDGKPVVRAAVYLVSGDRRLASGATGNDGTYKFEIEAEVIGQGQFAIQVQADPGSTSMKPSRAEPMIITIAAPQPVPVSYTIAAFLATGLAAAGFFLARSKPWRRLRRSAPAAEAAPAQAAEGELVGGLVANRPGVMSTLRRPNDEGFSGVVRDTVRGRPVGEAVVRLLLGTEEREVRTSADGSFAIEKLAAGEWRAEVAAAGHVTEKFGLSIPHRGELRGARIDLVPVRERVFQLYRRAAEPILPEARLWGIWSPRQIVDHVKAKKQSPALSDLTDFVEEIYFSPRLAAESVLPTASDRVERAIRERTRAASAPAPGTPSAPA
ncbi:MAG: carboxypeptidase-like regulatory domain-containing protein [Kofleriaceae bacterium]|nr:carboxypeptidase-like regulatory domain-containing protein [Kofleriaceae bacterium]